MAIEQKIKSVLLSAETILELAIIDPSRYGSIIHAIIPDYAEILLKIYLEDKIKNVPPNPDRRTFKQLCDEINIQPSNISIQDFQTNAQYFLGIRDDFRNPLHHKEYVQGFLIAQSIVLECLVKFNLLLHTLFPEIPSRNDLNYYSYIKFINMAYEEQQGLGDHEKYQRVNQALLKIEKREKFKCPSGYDSGRIFSVRQLFKQTDETFSIVALGYRMDLPQKIISILSTSASVMKTKNIIEKLKEDPLYIGLQRKEVESCLQHIQNKKLNSGEMIVILGGGYYLSQ